MANRLSNPNLFATTSPNWSLALLDQNAQNAQSAINDSSLGANNGPLTDTGTVNAYAVTCTYGTPSAYNNGMTIYFTPANTNTGAATITVAPLGSMAITRTDTSACTGGELVAGTTVQLLCDGTQFRIVSVPSTNAITLVRLRSFNAVGNPNFEVDQKQVGSSISVSAAGGNFSSVDRWIVRKAGSGTLAGSAQQGGGTFLMPGTNFAISRALLRFVLGAQEASLGASDGLQIYQFVEGPNLRELIGDVTSISLLVRSSVAPLKFGVVLKDAASAYSLAKLATISTANTVTLITFPNIPVWTGSATWTLTPGNVGYQIFICLAAGASVIAPSNDAWISGSYFGAAGQDNFGAQAVNSTFDLIAVQHEPGAVCSTLMDLDFDTNLSRCLRYFAKSYSYNVKPGTVDGAGAIWVPPNPISGFNGVYIGTRFPKVMAKIPPTVSGWSPATGGGGLVRDVVNSIDRTVTGAIGPNDSGFAGFSISGAAAATNLYYNFHYTADTGW